MHQILTRTIHGLLRLGLVAALASSGPAAFSQAGANAAWPTRPLRLVIGFPAGQATDRTARILAEKLSARIGQPVVVENRPGQAGSIALAMLKRAPADGYTMGLMATASLVTNPHLYKSVGYDSLTDFTPVSILGAGPLILVAHANAPFSTVDGLVKYAKANPGKLSYCSTGNGTISHLAMEEFKRRAEISLVHVPYQGSVQAMMDLSGGTVSVCFDTISGAQPSLSAGRIKVLAAASSKRMGIYPEVPTISESGYPGFEAAPYIGLLFPATTPSSIIDRIYAELREIKAAPEIREHMSNTGTMLIFGSPAEFSLQLREDYAKWRSVIQDTGVKLN